MVSEKIWFYLEYILFHKMYNFCYLFNCWKNIVLWTSDKILSNTIKNDAI